MNDDQDVAEFARLLQALSDGDPGARETLAIFHNWRAAERDAETATLVAAFGGDPLPGTVLVDGGTTQNPPAKVDATTVTMSDGRVLAKEDVLARTQPPAPPAA